MAMMTDPIDNLPTALLFISSIENQTMNCYN